MATLLPVIVKPLPYGYNPVSVAWTAGDNVNGNIFISTGKETLHAKGTGTVTVKSTPDPYGRGGAAGTGDIAQVLANNEFMFQRFNQTGYASGGFITVTSSVATVLLWVEQDPT
jgi:hypothetical protein